MSGPLHGLRVLDLTSNVMGPYATQILADMGADVIKVEAPYGDVTRHQGEGKTGLMGPLFMGLNRNKRSIVLDLKNPASRDALFKLAASAQVFVHSMRQPAADKLGLGFEHIREVRKDVVYCRAAGFGSDGPYADKPAYDDLIQALSGMCALNATIASQPRFTPTVFADKSVGLTLAYSILGGVYASVATGLAQQVEVPMLETMVSFLMVEHLASRTLDHSDGEAGYARVLDPNRKPYRTRDGYVCVLTYTDKHWESFARIVGRPEWALDERLATLRARGSNFDLMFRCIEETMPQRTTAQWLEALSAAGIPVAPVLGINEVFDDEHLRAVGMFSVVEHPTEGPMTQVRPPVRFGNQVEPIRRPQPKLGEHSVELLREAGLSDKEIESLQT